MPAWLKNKKIHIIMLLVLLAAGTGMRIFGAWSTAGSASSDHGVPCLMAKHFSEGKPLTVFHYGQPFMGSIEPIMSSIFCRIFGVNGFAANMGTAIFGILLLPLVYFWGRGAGGKSGGLAALAYCVIGTFAYFQMTTWCYGGYSAILFFFTAVMFLTARILDLETDEKKEANIWWYVLLGFTAGAGWWTSQLLAAAFVSAAVLFFVVLRLRVFSLKILFAAGAFVVGSLPFWVWNALNDWETFRLFSGAMGSKGLLLGLKEFFTWLLPLVLDISGSIWRIGLYVAAAISFLLLLFKSLRQNKLKGPSIYMLACISVLVFLPLLFGSSSYGAVRYLLPLVVVSAVFIGVVTAYLLEKLPFAIGVIPLLIVIGIQATALPTFLDWRKEDDAYGVKLEKFADFLEQKNINEVYVPYRVRKSGHALNFMLKERFVFCDPHEEHYHDNAVKAELTDSIAILNNYRNIAEFLSAAGGTAKIDGVPELILHHDFKPPENNLEEIAPAIWESARDNRGVDILGAVADGVIETAWRPEYGAAGPAWLEISFKEPVQVAAVRLLSVSRKYPGTWQVEAGEDNNNWKPVTEKLAYTGYFWSGIRPFWGSAYFRQEARFTPAKTSRLRIIFESPEDLVKCDITEMQVFTEGAGSEDLKDALPELVEFLGEQSVDQVYADRWCANVLYKEFGERIRVPVEPVFFADKKILDSEVALTSSTALVVKKENASLCRRVLGSREIVMRETAIGPWVYFYFTPETWREHYAACAGLYWAGYGCLAESRLWSYLIGKFADDLYGQGKKKEAVRLLKKAVQANSNYHDGIMKLSGWLREAGDVEEAERWGKIGETMWTPLTDAKIEFSKGVELIGVSISPEEVKPGELLDVSYYWSCSPDINTELIAVFVHFKGPEKTRFQDDHVLLTNVDVSPQPVPEVFIEKRQVRVPANAVPGEYEIKLGLMDRRRDNWRYKAKTNLRENKRAVYLPVSVKVR